MLEKFCFKTGVYKDKDGNFVAHNLDFDLVAVDKDLSGALTKLNICLVSYIEYGISQGYPVEDFYFPAPKEYWDRFEGIGGSNG